MKTVVINSPTNEITPYMFWIVVGEFLRTLACTPPNCTKSDAINPKKSKLTIAKKTHGIARLSQ
jgi:hypothetical protein